MLERRRQLGGGHAHVILQPEQETRVDAPRAGRHHQPFEGGEAHRGVDRGAALHRRQRGAGAEVAGDDPQLLQVAPGQLGGAPRRIGVGETVEAEPAQVPAVPPLRRQRVGGRGGRDVSVEGGVEAGHRRDPGEQPADQLQAPQGLRLVQGRQVGERLEPAADSGVHQHGLGELRAAVDDAMSDRVDGAVSRDGGPERGVVDTSRRGGDGLRGQRPIGVVEDGQLEAARSGIDDQDVHGEGLRVSSERPSPVGDLGRVLAGDAGVGAAVAPTTTASNSDEPRPR